MRIALILFTLPLVAFNVFAESEHHDHHHDHDEHTEDFTQHNAHEHGRVIVKISYSAHQMNLHLSLPAYNAFGFEHSPTNTDEQSIVDNTLALLNEPKNVFTTEPNCELVSSIFKDDHTQSSTQAEKHYDVEINSIHNCLPNQSISIVFSLFETIPSINQIIVQYISESEQKLITLDKDNTYITIN
ncbi:MAG: DUF2796 domain-containing protein [Gammaproteobacteria bacterium]